MFVSKLGAALNIMCVHTHTGSSMEVGQRVGGWVGGCSGLSPCSVSPSVPSASLSLHNVLPTYM